MRRILFLFVYGFVISEAFSGGSPLRTLVVVNKNSDRSLELGRYYAEQRGIPGRQIFSIATTTSNNIEVGTYSNEIDGPIRAYISSAGISNTIDFVVFSMDIPYRVHAGSETNKRSASLTSTFYYGFFSSPNGFINCNIASGSSNRYFSAESAFNRSAPYSSNRYLLATMITASNLPLAKRLINISTASDESSPQANVYLLKTGDARDIQWMDFEQPMFAQRFIESAPTISWLDAASLSGRTNIIGITAGLRFHTWISGNHALPGAIAEHLTSYGGCLFDVSEQIVDAGQMSILDWILHGYSGSYGTVVEPCLFAEKFPHPLYHFWYARGFNLGESLMMSVQNPYQGIIVGDPLCAPYTSPSSIFFSGLTNDAVVSGMISLTGMVVSSDGAAPMTRMDWWMNDRFKRTITNVPPAPGNQISVTVNGTSRTFTVKGGDSLYSVVTGLVEVLNQPPLPGVKAFGFGDRIEFRQTNLGESAAGWVCEAAITPGTAAVVTVSAHVPFTNFVETILPAREGITLSGASKSGDVVRAIITRLDGLVVTNEYTVTANATPRATIIIGLGNSIILNTNLQSSTGCFVKNVKDFNGTTEAWFYSRTNTWEGHNLFIDYQVVPVSGSTLSGPNFSDNFNDNAEVLGARANIFLSTGFTQLYGVVSVDTTNWPDGPHEIVLAAREGTGVETETRGSLNIHVDNHDLECAIDAPVHGIYRLKSGVLTVDVSTVVSVGTVTQMMLFAEGKPVATGLTASLSAEVALANYGAGPLNLQAQAWADAVRSTLSSFTSVQLYSDTDGDGLSDQWEFQNFVSNTNFSGANDVDGDGYSNYEEFIADTQPTNSASYLAIRSITDEVAVQFPASAERRYRIQLNDSDLISGLWYPAGSFFTGSNDVISWSDTTSNAPPATNMFRFYAVEPSLPQ